MNHPYKKYVLAEIASLGLPAVLLLIFLIKGYAFFILLALVSLTLSLILSAMTVPFTPPHIITLKQYARAVLLIFCVIPLLFIIF